MTRTKKKWCKKGGKFTDWMGILNFKSTEYNKI